MAAGDMHKSLVKFGHVLSEVCERTDRQTDKQTTITILCTPPEGEVMSNSQPNASSTPHKGRSRFLLADPNSAPISYKAAVLGNSHTEKNPS